VFDRYNFTIKEDEPLDKEVAVDPEMLGKVFEKMLDIIERKSKGTFYTPRDIVHYMCQESLINYLDNVLENKIPKKNIEVYIHEGHLALENDEQVARTGKETDKYKYQLPESIRQNAELIDTKLSEIRICDPAIGSGAFPVGMLHELVNAQMVLKPYFSTKYIKEKFIKLGLESTPKEISESRYVYRLKRHIIQESLYGVDIDASAIDIARLRLWLSLVVDEDNLDPIETLPNLDYKIVCGNSLIGIPEYAMQDLEVEKQLETLKEQFYNETNETQKKALRRQINSKICELLDSAGSFARYKIDFDFRLFFSEVWHEKGGFDVVIGNPPYDVYEGKHADELSIIKKIPTFDIAHSGKINAYKLFLAKSITLLKEGGLFNQIFQNSFLGDNSAKLLRKHFLTEQQIIKIDSFPERDDINKRVFKSAKMSVCILFSRNIKKYKYSFDLSIWKDRKMTHSAKSTFLNKEVLNFDKVSYVIPSVSQREKDILAIISNTSRFKKEITCFQGEINLSTNRDVIVDAENDETRPLLKGAGIQKWFLPTKMSQGKDEYLQYQKYLMVNNGEKSSHYKYSRIVMQGITGVDEKYRLKATIIKSGYFCGHSINYISLMNVDNTKAKYYLALLNSEFSNWYFKKFSTNSNVNSYEIHNLPCPIFKNEFEPITIICDYLIDNKKIISPILFEFYEQTINACIYEVIFYEHVFNANKQILVHLKDLKPITDNMTDEEKLAIIQSEFERLYDPNHPVRNAIETLDSIEEIRIIKEALK